MLANRLRIPVSLHAETIGPSSCLHAVALLKDPNFAVCVIQPGMRPLNININPLNTNTNILRPKVYDRKFG